MDTGSNNDNQNEYQKKFRILFEKPVRVTFTARVSNPQDSATKQQRDEQINDNKTRNVESENYALSLLDLHPGRVKFSDMAQKMTKIVIPGLEHFEGILGHVEEDLYMYDEYIESDLKLTKGKAKTGPPPKGAKVWVHMALYTEDQTDAFDNSKLNGKPHVCKIFCEVFQLTEEDTLPGILVACRRLSVGQRGKFLLPPSTMYGDLGCPDFIEEEEEEKEQPKRIPPSATILMLIHLLKWIDADAPQRYDSLADDSKKKFQNVKAVIDSINEIAVESYGQHKYRQAIELYEKLIFILNNIDDENSISDVNSQKYRTYLNLAICNLKLENPDQSILLLDEASVLGNFKNDSKYLYTKGRCFIMLEKYEEALEVLSQALELKPNNIEIGRELLKIDEKVAHDRSLENKISKKMLKNNQQNSVDGDFEKIKRCINNLLQHMKSNSIRSIPIPSTLVTEDVKRINELIEGENYRILTNRLPNGKFDWILSSIY